MLYTYRINNTNRTNNSIYIINYIWRKIVKIYIYIYYKAKKNIYTKKLIGIS